MELFLRDVKPWLKLDVVPITDVYGPTAWDEELEGLVVSHETAKGGEAINKERKRKVRGWGRGRERGDILHDEELEGLVVSHETAKDGERKVRGGGGQREGERSYSS